MARQSFEAWMARVDRNLEKLCGMGHRDLPDWGFWDAWDDGCTAKQAAVQVLRESGGGDLIDEDEEGWE